MKGNRAAAWGLFPAGTLHCEASMARIMQDSVLPPSNPVLPTPAQAASYDHGHASSVGHGHGVIRNALREVVPAAPVPQRVTLVSAVDEHADQPVALALRVHDEARALRPSLFPPRRGQRLPQGGLPSTSAQRLAMLREHIDTHKAAQALSILAD